MSIFLEFIAGGQMKLCTGQAQPSGFPSSLPALGDPNIDMNISAFPSRLFWSHFKGKEECWAWLGKTGTHLPGAFSSYKLKLALVLWR